MFYYKPLKEETELGEIKKKKTKLPLKKIRHLWLDKKMKTKQSPSPLPSSHHETNLSKKTKNTAEKSKLEPKVNIKTKQNGKNNYELLKNSSRTPINTRVIGPGGTLLPQLSELPNLVDGKGRVSVMCFTWNIASESTRGLHRLNAVFAKMPLRERPDIISVALQELPTSTLKFHRNVTDVIGEALSTTHQVFCWVRKWSQMLIIFVRKQLIAYASRPEYKFVGSTTVAQPFRTKGAIGIGFRLLQTSCIFISCHLTHGKLKKRILDYHKISRSFDFKCFRRTGVVLPLRELPNNNTMPTKLLPDQPIKGNILKGLKTYVDNNTSKFSSFEIPEKTSPTQSLANNSTALPLKRASNVFWFGDLNFRVRSTPELHGIGERLENKLFRRNLDYQPLLDNDELNVERRKGLLFEDFKEGVIQFPPTHKFVVGTNKYAKNRIPSYTDRVLYWSRVEEALLPIRYDCVWDMTTSDHKPVYCIFQMNAIDEKSIKTVSL